MTKSKEVQDKVEHFYFVQKLKMVDIVDKMDGEVSYKYVQRVIKAKKEGS